MSDKEKNENNINCDTCGHCGDCNECERDYPIFTKEMKKTHTILLPTMLPMHFAFLSQILESFGFHTVLLENGTHGDNRKLIDNGLKYVHNDTCYPALLLIGQFLDAIESGAYDIHKIALLISQTGGGCRASNYIVLLRKALKKAGYGFIPVISFNIAGLEKGTGFSLTLPMLHRMMYAVTYGDLLLHLRNQVRPYEAVKGTAEEHCKRWTTALCAEMQDRHALRYSHVKKNYLRILDDFAAIPRKPDAGKKVRVGIVGEIFVKFSPLGNNQLEDFLISEDAEPVMSGFYDFALYCVYDWIEDYQLYRMDKKLIPLYRIAYRFLCHRQMDLINIIKKHGFFRTMSYFDETKDLVDGVISRGVKMGEGWLLTAEMLELIHSGVNNIICVQPFGCLPNHIVGKGMMKPLKERHPSANIVSVDYDPSATRINQENRIKLMLANAKEEDGGR